MIGATLVDACLKQGIHCVCLIRPHTKRIARLPTSPLIQMFSCPLEEMKRFEPAEEMQDCDVFYHLGWAGTSKTARYDASIQAGNIQYTLDAVALAKKMGCHTFVGVGSQAEYGRKDHAIKPEETVAPDMAYGIAKYAAGQLSALRAKELGLGHIWGRVFSVYGPWDNEGTLVRSLLEQFAQGQCPPLTACQQIWDYLYMSDAGEALRLIGEKGQAGKVYNIASGQARPLREFVEITAAHFKDLPEIPFGSLPYGENQVMHLCGNIASLQEDTGFRPAVSFEEGIRRTIRRMEEQQQ